MSFIQRVYDCAPIFMQNIMVTTSGFLKNKVRHGKKYYEHLEFLKTYDNLSLSEKIKHQTEEMVNLINYAKENSEFYKRFYKDIDIKSIKTIEDLKKLPILDKETLRVNINDIVTISKRDAVEGHTGGTTGKSLIVLMTKEDMMKRMAILDNFKSKLGFAHLKMRRATFNGKHIVPPEQKKKVFWRYNASSKQMIYSSFHLTDDNIKYYVKSLNKFKPKSIDGFFTSICDIASYIERNDLNIDFRLVAIFPTSETVSKSGRRLLERVFKCKVYDQYASSEGAPFVTECIDQVLHVNLDSGIFEHYDNDSNEVLVTSFTTYGTPLIRYKIEDSMIFANKNKLCTCGNPSRVIEKISGRSLDFLYTYEGARINEANVANLFKNMPNTLIKAQLIQSRLDEIQILLEVDKEKYISKHDDLLMDEFKYKFGNRTKIVIKHVDVIPREKSGKFRMIKNNLRRVVNE